MTEPSTHEERLLAIVRRYQAEKDAGRCPDRAALLAAHPDLAGELAGYLDALDALCAAAGLARLPAPVNPETALGDFRILREIGRGGMGIVYEAEQISLGRRVALKVLSLAGALDDRQLARFRNEARAAAHLHHSNIVPVHAVGCERGVHFYAMQLIDGRTLAETLAAERERREMPVRSSVETAAAVDTLGSGPLSGPGEPRHRGVARLMMQAAEALDYAHRQGVIHRDVKPANLLLDGRGQLWVTDFGLAQFASGIDLTRTGDVLGTLRYASPEQASGQGLLDHRADVYSLGATFYELLTLAPPFAGATRGELLRQILDEEPRPPRQLDRTLPAELETIVLKCLSKSPSDRYGTARDLADDLGRFLANRPILARRPSLLDRGRKWLRRHPGVSAVASLSLVALTVGLIINQALLAREQDRTREALDREKVRAEQAERRLKQTRELVGFLIELGEEEPGHWPNAMLGQRRRMLETALAHYQALIADSEGTGTTDLEAARARVKQLLADLVALQSVDNAMLLNSDGVLDDLKPDAKQRARIKEEVSKLGRERFRTLFDRELTPAQRRKLGLEQARAGEQAVARLLTPAQRSRLGQVALQLKGLVAFREPEVVSALGLTPEQRQQIREIESEMFLPPPGPPRKGGGPPFDFNARCREGMARCLEVLTAQQRKKWQKLAGEPYAGPHPFAPPPFPGPKKL